MTDKIILINFKASKETLKKLQENIALTNPKPTKSSYFEWIIKEHHKNIKGGEHK